MTSVRFRFALSPFGGGAPEPGCVCSDLASPAIEAALAAAGASGAGDSLPGLDVSAVILRHLLLRAPWHFFRTTPDHATPGCAGCRQASCMTQIGLGPMWRRAGGRAATDFPAASRARSE